MSLLIASIQHASMQQEPLIAGGGSLLHQSPSAWL
jgi:hypothetical protein